MVQPVPRLGEEVNRRKRLTQCQRPWGATRETCENGTTRSSDFDVPNTSNFWR